MTTRARWILAIAISGMVMGVLGRFTHFAVLNLIFISWIAIEWFFFRVKNIGAGDIFAKAERTIDGNGGKSLAISLHEKYEVVLKVTFRRGLNGLRFFVHDLVPQGIESNDQWPAIVDLQVRVHLQWKYKIMAQVTGKLAFPGLQVTVTDKFGFFRLQKFVPLRQELTLLPLVIQPKTTAQRVKRDNIQLLSGHHRFRKPGISSELLGIREYQRGDPPRSIAWKATAKTGKLMTCEYESEVPIRSTILVDVSGYQFWGRPGPAPFDSIASAVGSLTRLLIEDKDPVGVVLARGQHKTRICPGLGQRQFVRILQSLLNSHPGSSAAQEFPVRDLEVFVWKSIYRMYPELLSDSLNVVKIPLLLFGPRRRYQFSVRRQSAIALSWILGENLASGYKLTFDDSAYRTKCNEFFSRHPSVVNEAFLVADFGSARRDKDNAVQSICQGLIESVARARDNELFVLVGDFNVQAATFRKLVDSVRVARARLHRVMIVNIPSRDVTLDINDSAASQAFDYIQSMNRKEEIRHYGALQQLGASLSFLSDVDLVEKVAAELQILKTSGSRGPVLAQRAGI